MRLGINGGWRLRGAVSKSILTATAGLAALTAFEAQAQTTSAAPAADMITEVVVTARRREERLQEVPVAVTAFDGSQLERQGIRQLADIQNQTPSLSANTGGIGSRAYGSYTLRGLSQGFGGAVSVLTYLSEVNTLLPNVGASLFDVSSVQVLKGPQGTLFGKSATGGAIVVTPTHPELNEWGGRASATIGNLGRQDFSAALNIPLVDDQLAARIAYSRQRRDGYTRMINVPGGKLDAQDMQSARASIEWRPFGGKLTTYGMVQYDEWDQSPPGHVLVGYNPLHQVVDTALFTPEFALGPGTSAILNFLSCPASAALGYFSSTAACVSQTTATLASYRPIVLAEVARTARGGDELRRSNVGVDTPFIDRGEQTTFVNISTFDVGDLGFTTLQLKNIFSYQTARAVSAFDLDGVPVNFIDSAGGQLGTQSAASGSIQQTRNRILRSDVNLGPDIKRYTNEFQVSGSVRDDLIVWLAGYYYEKAPIERHTAGTSNFSRLPDFALVFGLAGPAIDPAIPPTTPGGFTAFTNFKLGGSDKEEAVFGQATVDLSALLEGLHFTAGYRDTKNRSRVLEQTAVLDPATGRVSPGVVLPAKVSRSSGEGYTLALDWKVNDDLLLYATHRKGYKPGGSNNVVGCGTTAPNCNPSYSPETVKDIEVGVKYDFTYGDWSGRINVAAYDQDYTDLLTTINQNSVPFVANAGSATLRGIEVETYIAPTRSLLFTGSYSYNDNYYNDFVTGDPTGVLLGTSACLPGFTATQCFIDAADAPFGAPKHKGAVSARYQLPLEESVGTVFATVEASYQSRKFFGGTLYTSEARSVFEPLVGAATYKDWISQKAHTLINLRADWENIYGTGASLSAYVRNVTDKTYAVGGLPLVTAGFITKVFGEPRTYGVILSYEF